MKKQKISRWEKQAQLQTFQKWRKETEKYKFSALLEEYNIRELEI